jgi:hypothetical protein
MGSVPNFPVMGGEDRPGVEGFRKKATPVAINDLIFLRVCDNSFEYFSELKRFPN